MPITPAGSATELCNAGAGGGGGDGTVTSITDNWVAVPEVLVNGAAFATITTSGTFTHTKVVQAANTVWAGPVSGAAAVPVFRLLVAGDIPDLGSLYWRLTGNTGTVLGTNYIGTNDNTGWMVKTNSIESFRVFPSVSSRAGHVTFANAADRAQVTIDRDLDWTDTSTYKNFHLSMNVTNAAGADSGVGSDGPRVIQSNATHAAGPTIVGTRYTWNTAMSCNFIYTGAASSTENAGLSIYANFGGGYSAGAHSNGSGGFYSKAAQAGDGSQRWLGHECVWQKPKYQTNDSSLMVDAQAIGHAAYWSSEVALTTASVNAGFTAACFESGSIVTANLQRQGHGFFAWGVAGKNWTYPFAYRDASDASLGTTAIQATDKFRVDWTGLVFSRFAVLRPDAAAGGTGFGNALDIAEDATPGTENIITAETSVRTARYGLYFRHQSSNWTADAIVGVDAAMLAGGAASGTFTGNFIQCRKDGNSGANLKFWVEANGNVRGRFLDIGPRADAYVASAVNTVAISELNYQSANGVMSIFTPRGDNKPVVFMRTNTGAYTGAFLQISSNTGDSVGTPIQGNGSFAGYYALFTDFTAATPKTKFYVDYDSRVFHGNVAAPPSAPTGGGILYVDAGALKYVGSSGTVTTVAPA